MENSFTLDNVEIGYQGYALTLKESKDYWPFGLELTNPNSPGIVAGRKYPYGFNGKEEQNELGLEWLDFGARMYMPDIGRWGVSDKLAEVMRSQSTYNYAWNNPIYLIDKDGNAPSKPDDVITTVNSIVSENSSKLKRDVSIHVTLTVVNLSGSDLSDTMFSQKSGNIRLSNFEGESFNFTSGTKMTEDQLSKFTVDFVVVESLDDIREKDNVLLVVDNIPETDKETNPVGLAGNGVVAVESGTISNGSFNEVAQHEIAHDVGSEHRVGTGLLMGESVNGSTKVHKLSRGEMIFNQVGSSNKKGTVKDSENNVRFDKTEKQNVQDFIKENKITF